MIFLFLFIWSYYRSINLLASWTILFLGMYTDFLITLRRTSSGDASVASNSAESQFVEEEKLTKEEWQAINKMLSYQTDEDVNSFSGKDLQNMIHFLIDVSIGQAAARIININEIEVVCGRFEQLDVTTKLYHKSIHCDVSLKYCGLSCPEGSLAEVSLLQGPTCLLLISCFSCCCSDFIRKCIAECCQWEKDKCFGSQFCTCTCWGRFGLATCSNHFSVPCYGTSFPSTYIYRNLHSMNDKRVAYFCHFPLYSFCTHKLDGSTRYFDKLRVNWKWFKDAYFAFQKVL